MCLVPLYESPEYIYLTLGYSIIWTPCPCQVSFGYSVLEALTARYTGQRGELGEVDKDEM
jgi:hypothetical protein